MMATAQETTTPPPRFAVVMPDGKPYSDVDWSARLYPEAGNGSRPAFMLISPHLSPVPRLTYEGWRAATTNHAKSAERNFGRALRISPNDRHLLWAYGWSQLNLDNPALAMAAFQRNLALRPGTRPQWLPMAMALTYTAVGERDAAVAWYRAAAQSDPERWGTDNRVLLTTVEWTPKERALVKQLLHDASQGSAPEPTHLAQR